MFETARVRGPGQNHPHDHRLLGIATSLILAGFLILAPSSAWFTSAASDATITSWQLRGNRGTSPSTNFLGTTDNNALVLRTNNVEAIRILSGSGTTGGNVGIGTTTPAFPLDVRGDVNTSTRYDIGGTPILQAPAGTGNTFLGPSTGNSNSTGGNNVAVGELNLMSNTTGDGNTAIGPITMIANTTGSTNVAIGVNTLNLNTSGSNNVAIGHVALGGNTVGTGNTAVGEQAGGYTLPGMGTGSYNTYLGYLTRQDTATPLTNATAIGNQAAVSASNALVLGGTGSYAVNVGIGTESPQSTLQVAGNGSYGSYLQIPIVSSTSAPPVSDCNTTNLAGRMVLQDNAGTVTLWVCSAATGAWVADASAARVATR